MPANRAQIFVKDSPIVTEPLELYCFAGVLGSQESRGLTRPAESGGRRSEALTPILRLRAQLPGDLEPSLRHTKRALHRSGTPRLRGAGAELKAPGVGWLSPGPVEVVSTWLWTLRYRAQLGLTATQDMEHSQCCRTDEDM